MKKKERQTSDHCFIRSRKLSQPTGKLNCPLAFTVKNCYSPRIQDPEKTQRKKTEMAAKVKKEITASRSAKNDQETFTKDEEKQLHLKKNLSQVFYCKF